MRRVAVADALAHSPLAPADIQELIRDFWKENLKDAIPLDSYVVDFVCQQESRVPPYNMKVTVVELNPFGEFASGGLFKWEVAHDKDVLLGKKPFEFRVAAEPQKDVLQRLPLAWKDYILNPTSPRRGSKVDLMNTSGGSSSSPKDPHRHQQP